MKTIKLIFVDCAGNNEVVTVSNSCVSSLIQVTDIVLNEKKYFESNEAASKYLYEKNLINPYTGRAYKRICNHSVNLKKTNKTSTVFSEELKQNK